MSDLSRRRVLATGVTAALTLGALVGGTAAAGAAAPRHPSVRQPAAHHAIPFTSAAVTQQADGSFRITWAAAPGVRRVTVYAGRDQRHIAHGHPVAVSRGSAGVTVPSPGTADRWWFELVPDHGEPLTLADRSLHLASAPNFRDAGGYRTADGQWVRMGVLYRSGDLSKLTDADLAKLHRLGLRTDVDLRTAQERSDAPDRLPAGTTYVVADVLGDLGGFGGAAGGALPTTEEGAVRMMEQGEQTMVTGDTARQAYAALADAAGDPRGAALVYHCTAGKDRTGWASAVLLTALGVPRATVMDDYLASNTYRAEENAAALAQLPEAMRPAYKALLDVRPEYLNAGFDQVAASYGSFDRYLDKALGLNAKDVRDLRGDLLVG